MDPLIDFSSYGFDNENLHIQSTNLDTSFMNAIRRSVMTTVKRYALTSEVNSKRLNNFFPSLNLSVNNRNFSVLKSTCGNIELLSDRLSLLSINDLAPRITSKVHNVFFVLCDGTYEVGDELNEKQISKPYVNETDRTRIIYAHDLLVVEYVESDDSKGADDSKGDDGEESKEVFVVRDVKKYITYNTNICSVRSCQYLHIISELESGYGIDHAKWNACTTRYRFVPKVEPNPFGTHETSGQIWKKKMDYEKTHDFFGGPKTIDLKMEYNGVSNTRKILDETMSFISDQLDYFLVSYESGTGKVVSEKEDLIKINNKIIRTEEGVEVGFIGDHSIGNLLSSYLLRLFLSFYKDKSITKKKEIYEKTNISYRKAHPQHNYITLRFQIPKGENDHLIDKLNLTDDPDLNAIKTELLKKTVDIIKDHLKLLME